MSYYRSPFTLIDDIFSASVRGREVYVVSDEQYKQLRAEQAKDEIAVLQKRLESYEKTAESLRETIAEIQKENNLLTESKDAASNE